MPFVYFWDSTVQVVNLARNGRSTSSFRKEGLWDQIMKDCSAGDYVLIQFGHNDEVPTKKRIQRRLNLKITWSDLWLKCGQKRTTGFDHACGQKKI